MTIIQLYLFFQPLIDILGIICLVTLIAGGILFAVVWVIRKLWMYMLAFGAAAFALCTVMLIFGA